MRSRSLTVENRTRSTWFAQQIWMEVLRTVSPIVRRVRRLMNTFGIGPALPPEQLAKVIPIAPYLKPRAIVVLEAVPAEDDAGAALNVIDIRPRRRRG